MNWRMETVELRMETGEQRMEDREWKVHYWATVSCHYSTYTPNISTVSVAKCPPCTRCYER